MRQKAFRSFPNRYPFSLYYEVISSFSIRYNLEIILQCNLCQVAMQTDMNYILRRLILACNSFNYLSRTWHIHEPTSLSICHGKPCSFKVNEVSCSLHLLSLQVELSLINHFPSFSCVTFFRFSYFFRCSCGKDCSTTSSSLRTNINDVVT